MTVLPMNISFNMTDIEELSSYDMNGAIIYIIGVLIWYSIGFGLILIDGYNPQPGFIASHKHVSVYQAVNDLHKHQARNDILLELKDKNRRLKLWQIYYDKRRRLLRHSISGISIDQPDRIHDDDTSDSESFHSFQNVNDNKPKEHSNFI